MRPIRRPDKEQSDSLDSDPLGMRHHQRTTTGSDQGTSKIPKKLIPSRRKQVMDLNESKSRGKRSIVVDFIPGIVTAMIAVIAGVPLKFCPIVGLSTVWLYWYFRKTRRFWRLLIALLAIFASSLTLTGEFHLQCNGFTLDLHREQSHPIAVLVLGFLLWKLIEADQAEQSS
jgi:hypothetical protein